VTGDQPSVQRNMAARRARGEIIYFIDNDSFVTPGSVELALSIFRKDPRIAIVGGPSLTPASDSLIQRCFGLVLSSVFAVGPRIRSRYAPTGKPRMTDEFELILCNMFVRRKVFLDAGGFDERLYPNEENAFINTVQKAGHLAFYDPSIRVERGQRRGIGSFIRQMFTYGRGRADQFRFQPSSFNLSLLIPAGFALYVAAFAPAILLLPPGVPRLVWALPLLLHLLLNAVFSLEAAVRGRGLIALPALPFLFVIVHVFYGLGLIAGSLGGTRRRGREHHARIDHESFR
jgi:cellulose synthase/poly-beta-1,6-N-acetylglucosamine synthase-like glycosyltransferase